MPSGLAALLDDVAAIAKLAAASVDDIGAAAGRASMKAAGVVVDDAAVTPRYVTGFTPDRELPIIWRIAKGSLRNKLLFIVPVALALSVFLPWLLTPILMLGGAYLCFEGAEKVWEALTHEEHPVEEDVATLASAEHEEKMVSGAVRTDFILSAEIMVIALNELTSDPANRPSIWMLAISLAAVALGITVLVYGVVGLIVKMDDIGLKLAERADAGSRALGRGLVKAMPRLLAALSVIGIAAMIWVGGGIIVHGLAEFGVDGPEHVIHNIAVAAGHALPPVDDLVEWIVEATGAGLIGLALGAAIVAVHHAVAHRQHK